MIWFLVLNEIFYFTWSLGIIFRFIVFLALAAFFFEITFVPFVYQTLWILTFTVFNFDFTSFAKILVIFQTESLHEILISLKEILFTFFKILVFFRIKTNGSGPVFLDNKLELIFIFCFINLIRINLTNRFFWSRFFSFIFDRICFWWVFLIFRFFLRFWFIILRVTYTVRFFVRRWFIIRFIFSFFCIFAT